MDLNKYRRTLIGINYIKAASNPAITPLNSDGTDESLVFKIINKNINVPMGLKDILVQGDHNSRKIRFVIDRFFDGVDLSKKDFLINYKNAVNQSGYDEISDINIIEDTITFDWWVLSNVTTNPGLVEILIEIIDIDETESVIYRYQTVPAVLSVEKTVVVGNNAEPADYYLDIKLLNDSSGYITYKMSSSEIPVLINNRTIVMPALDDIAVTQDTRSKLITFKIQRYIDSVDLSEKTLCIKFKLNNNTGDRALACNKIVSDTQISFNWMLDSKVTSREGKVEFAIEFIGYNEKNEFYCWNTLPAYIFVKKGLDVDNIIEHPTASWMQSWTIMADKYLHDFQSYFNEINTSVHEAMSYAQQALETFEKIKLESEIIKNNAEISYDQANRIDQSVKTFQTYYQDFRVKYDIFQTEYDLFDKEKDNFRLCDVPLDRKDFTEALQHELDGLSINGHTHKPNEVLTNQNNMFVTDWEKEVIHKSRTTDVPIMEEDLDESLVTKINGAGAGGDSGGGIIIPGVQIDDTQSTNSTTNSSKEIDRKIQVATNNKVEKIGGMGLSERNYTVSDQTKLGRIEDGANKYIHPAKHPPTVISTDKDNRFVTDMQIAEFLNKYTKTEIDNIISSLVLGMIWKDSVETFEDIEVKYPLPQANWTLKTTCDGATYIYNATDKVWIKTGNGEVPLATQFVNGLLSFIDKLKLDNIEPFANNYIHPDKHPLSMITETETLKILTDGERIKLAGLDNTLNERFKEYRMNKDKISKDDIAVEFINEIFQAGGININDELISTKSTYSSAHIENSLNLLSHPKLMSPEEYELLSNKTGIYYISKKEN